MPIYEYTCLSCNHHFETLVRGGAAPACPQCQSVALEKMLSVFATSSDSSKALPPMCGPCVAAGGCGNPKGPGACGF